MYKRQVENLSYPTTKTTSGLILLSKAAAQPAQVNPCIRCGRCVESVSYTHLDVYKRQVLEHLLGRINLPGMWWIISERWL